ncbi:MAG: hypothetical protein R8N50_01215 [Alphaproteobacteria bacterium]|nr:hypothetical protein [Alphaproteobacteria bacterium]
MFHKKAQVIVGLTTFYDEFLGLSVPGLAKLGSDFILIIYNDNPNIVVKKRRIRDLGYRGGLYVINGDYNKGQLGARLAILDFARKHKLKSDWFVFADDDDILTSLNVPKVSQNNFAIIQNMVVVRTRLIDVLRLMRDSGNYVVDNENVRQVRPHIGLAGTLVRYNAIMRMADVLNSTMQNISVIDESLSFRPPVDMMMWSALNIIARHDAEASTPIYMDTVNYIAIDIDTCPIKYGMRLAPTKNASLQISRAIAKYDAVVRAALVAENAAPKGQKSDVYKIQK